MTNFTINSSPHRETRTWDETDPSDRRFDGVTPTCRNHHEYVGTVPVPEAGVWVCPSCGEFSDTAESYNGGYGLVEPTITSPELFVTVDGRVLLRGDNSTFPTSWGRDAALLKSKAEIRRIITNYDGWRSWNNVYNAWMVPYDSLSEVRTVLEEGGYELINIHDIVAD